MASDDEILDPDDIDPEDGFSDAGEEDEDIDPDLELDESEIDNELDPDLGEDELGDDDEVVAIAEEDEDELDSSAPVKRPKRTGDDEEDDLTKDDDVEEDLAKILSERLRERASEDGDTEEEEEEESPASADPETSILPKRPDERMCPQCFLLVRKGAPICLVADDTCPLFPS